MIEVYKLMSGMQKIRVELLFTPLSYYKNKGTINDGPLLSWPLGSNVINLINNNNETEDKFKTEKHNT